MNIQLIEILINLKKMNGEESASQRKQPIQLDLLLNFLVQISPKIKVISDEQSEIYNEFK
jgi:hypothetical protein